MELVAVRIHNGKIEETVLAKGAGCFGPGSSLARIAMEKAPLPALEDSTKTMWRCVKSGNVFGWYLLRQDGLVIEPR